MAKNDPNKNVGTTEEVVVTAADALQNPFNNITIKKAKLKDSLHLEVEYEERVLMGHNDVKKTCDAIVHDDMKKAFSKLSFHIKNICELHEHVDVQAKGFTIGGSGDHEGVCLFGSSKLDLGTMNVVTPFVKWDSDYGYSSELGEVIEECKSEVLAYLFEGKKQPDAPTLFDEVEERIENSTT